MIPGYDGSKQDPKVLAKEAIKVGFPVLLKASAGGGGKGMKLVREEAELPDAIASATREAQSSFGDGTLLVEKYVDDPRHVEIQILGDSHGNLIHLNERECSIQRRHQKIIEETPSPALDTALRNQMGEAAVSCGKAIGYQNAGTVEFILAPDRSFYFLEVNTRLQVEHPVTECVTGLDLVEEQILVAQGEGRFACRKRRLVSKGLRSKFGSTPRTRPRASFRKAASSSTGTCRPPMGCGSTAAWRPAARSASTTIRCSRRSSPPGRADRWRFNECAAHSVR